MIMDGIMLPRGATFNSVGRVPTTGGSSEMWIRVQKMRLAASIAGGHMRSCRMCADSWAGVDKKEQVR